VIAISPTEQWPCAKNKIPFHTTVHLRKSKKLLILFLFKIFEEKVGNYRKKINQCAVLAISFLSFNKIVYANSILTQHHVKHAETLSDLADNLVSQIDSVAQLMVALSYVSGVGFAISAIYKFKQHKDNPTQVPVANAFAILAVSILLVFLPGLFKPAARSVFGTTNLTMVQYTQMNSNEPIY
jgi:hypothetical protein